MRRRLDIPLHGDGSIRFLPWLIALMVYLAALALAGVLALDGALEPWNRALNGTLTVQIPPAEGNEENGLAAALAVLRATPGVIAAEPLSRAATAKLLEPWLGTALTPEELALPRLIDVRIDPAAPPDLAALRARLATLPGAVLDEHRLWLDGLADLALSIEITALLILALIGAVAVLTVIFTTRAGLAVHHGVIEVLHLIGARDGYIARQFARQVLSLGLRGGIAGLALAVLTLLGIGHAGAAMPYLGQGVGLLPALTLAPWHWAVLAGLPLAVALIAMITASIVVRRALARMP